MSVYKSFFLILFLFVSFYTSEGQEVPVCPVSYRIFTPYIINPAIIGSKDYSSINTIASFQKKADAQLISIDTRLSKTVPKYFSSPKISEFRNIGLGCSFFNDLNGKSKNIGAIASVSYHVRMNRRSLSFLSLGTSIKAVQNTMNDIDTGDSSLNPSPVKTFFPNLDLGVYFYSPRFFAGFSGTNLLGNPGTMDSLGVSSVPVSQQYYFLAGYKILLSRNLDIVLEPSVIINTDDSGINNVSDIIHPLLKLYLSDFCLGSYYNSNSKVSFFFQYKFPDFSIGAYVDLPKNSSYYLKQPIIEIMAGINITRDKSKSVVHSRW